MHTRRIQTIVGVVTKRSEIFKVQANYTEEKYVIPLSVMRIDRAELLSVENPNYAVMISKYPHLKGVYMEDTDLKMLPVHDKLWKVLVRGRFHPVAFAGDIHKAFLQVRIHVQDRDALRFHWLAAKDPQRTRTYR